MSRSSSSHEVCSICGKTFPLKALVPASTLRESIVQRVQAERPEWTPEGYVCRPDLNRYRNAYVSSLLESERGDLSSLEADVVRSLREGEILARDLEDSLEQGRTLGERLADGLADFGGSWLFLGLFAAFLAVWILVNSLVLLRHPPDPYPYILLNLILSCLAAIQAPVIMMSQNGQEAKDRIRAQNDFKVNLKAELEIRYLHEKLDHLLVQQWERLTEIQEIQLELLSELGRR